MIHRRADAERALFRRERRRADQPAGLGIFHEKIHEEKRRLLHGGISAGEKYFVASEKIMLPQMLAEPRAAGRPDAVNVVDGRSAAPEVGVVMHHPAATTVLLLGGARAADRQIVNHVEQRLVTFA